MSLNFFQKFLGVKTDDAINGLTEMAAGFDPEGASEADIRVIEDKLQAATQELVGARRDYNKEKREADDARATYNGILDAIDDLQAAVDGGDQVADNQLAIDELYGELNEMKTNVEREIQEADEAKEFLDLAEETTKDIAQQLKDARLALTGARRDMEIAKKREAQATKQADRIKRMQGIRSGSGGTSVALKAMQRRAEKAKIKAEAAKVQTELLRPASQGAGRSSVAKAALERAKSKQAVSSATKKTHTRL